MSWLERLQGKQTAASARGGERWRMRTWGGAVLPPRTESVTDGISSTPVAPPAAPTGSCPAPGCRKIGPRRAGPRVGPLDFGPDRSSGSRYAHSGGDWDDEGHGGGLATQWRATPVRVLRLPGSTSSRSGLQSLWRSLRQPCWAMPGYCGGHGGGGAPKLVQTCVPVRGGGVGLTTIELEVGFYIVTSQKNFETSVLQQIAPEFRRSHQFCGCSSDSKTWGD